MIFCLEILQLKDGHDDHDYIPHRTFHLNACLFSLLVGFFLTCQYLPSVPQTACGLQLLFYALATNKDKQEKLAEELLTHMGKDGHLTASLLNKLVYLKASVKESMR